MTGPLDLSRAVLRASLPTGWQLWRVDGRALWLRPVKTYSPGAGRVANAYEILGAA